MSWLGLRRPSTSLVGCLWGPRMIEAGPTSAAHRRCTGTLGPSRVSDSGEPRRSDPSQGRVPDTRGHSGVTPPPTPIPCPKAIDIGISTHTKKLPFWFVYTMFFGKVGTGDGGIDDE